MVWASKETRNAYQRAYRLTKGMKPRVRRSATPCAVCAAPIRQSNRRYCSGACQFQDTTQRKLNAWLFEDWNPPHRGEGDVPAYVRRFWLATYGERCVLCGWAERRPKDGRIPLTWDHIDGDCSNNRYSNLRLLCPNCHALTDTYGSLNKVSRRKRWGR